MRVTVLEPADHDRIRAAAGASGILRETLVQSLWSGYGALARVDLEGSDHASVVVKRVRWPTDRAHPRGWSTSRGHARKVRSYAVEAQFYRDHAPRCGPRCRVPALLASESVDDGVLLILEDLDAAGFARRPRHIDDAGIDAALRWLAHFHAAHLDDAAAGLWPVGTYWHLDTRPDELAVLGDTPLARAAGAIDRALRDSPHQTLVHGDAKLANLCFSNAGDDVAAVDFQYVGGGVGIKDVAYFLGSALDEDALADRDEALLDTYFGHLDRALDEAGHRARADAVIADWRRLYPLAWTDFYRFLAGWSPGHWKIHDYTRRLADEVLAAL